jgi:hypothetical protein
MKKGIRKEQNQARNLRPVISNTKKLTCAQNMLKYSNTVNTLVNQMYTI